jgi:hypothetical protein
METTPDDLGARVGENFDELRSELGDRVQEIRETIGNYVDAHPLASVGIAFGVGYLLSGALFSRTTLKAATLGGRFALGGFLKQLVAGVGPGILAAALGGSGQGQSAATESTRGGKGNGGNRS